MLHETYLEVVTNREQMIQVWTVFNSIVVQGQKLGKQFRLNHLHHHVHFDVAQNVNARGQEEVESDMLSFGPI